MITTGAALLRACLQKSERYSEQLRTLFLEQNSNAQSFILDLRDNVGGVVLSGYEVSS